MNELATWPPKHIAPIVRPEAQVVRLPPLNDRIEQAYAECFAPLSRYARMLSGGSDARAEDLVQAVFVSLIHSERAGQWPQNVRAYLFGALIQLDRSQRRDASRRNAAYWEGYARILQNQSKQDTNGIGPDDLVRAIQKLSDDQREVVLRYQAGLSFREIANALDIPEKTACSRHYAALDRLKSLLSRG